MCGGIEVISDIQPIDSNPLVYRKGLTLQRVVMNAGLTPVASDQSVGRGLGVYPAD